MGDYAKAEPLYKEALEIRQKVLGPEHPNTATSLNNLAYLELDLGENQEAKRLGQLGYTADLKVFSQILSFKHANTSSNVSGFVVSERCKLEGKLL